ncbi:tetratricopeptide repeat protein [Pseudomonas sp. NPDC089422]|uniref:tetratricopeptide repeat protein n=1 Tax=Pseudomonas sp. NPDC089422 TaxID=3364466 RepID=UPI0037FBB175
MDLSSELMEVVAKYAGLAGIAVLTLAGIFYKVLAEKILVPLGPDKAYKILRMVIGWAGVIAILGIGSWVALKIMERPPSEEEKVSAAVNNPHWKAFKQYLVTGRDYTKAFEEVSAATEEGNPLAQTQVALFLMGGVGTQKDLSRSIDLATKSLPYLTEWCEKLKNPAACLYLGLLYSNGLVVGKDEKHAAKLIRLSAEGGYSRSFGILASLYEAGEGLDEDLPAAKVWYEKSIKAGYPYAMYALAMIYRQDLDSDKDKFVTYLSMAEGTGYPPALLQLSKEYLDGEVFEKNDEVSRRYLEKSQSDDFPEAYNEIGHRYAAGYGGYPLEEEKAVYFYKRAAELGDLDAMVVLASCLASGWGTKKDYSESLKWSWKAYNQGNKNAALELAIRHLNGQGVKKDESKGLELMQEAAEGGNLDAAVRLATSYIYGEKPFDRDLPKALSILQKGVEASDGTSVGLVGVVYLERRKYPEAIEYFKQAVELGHAYSAYELGYMYENGLGVARDLATAKKYYHQASVIDSGDADYEMYAAAVEYELSTSVEQKLNALNKVIHFSEAGSPWAQYRLYSIYSKSAVDKEKSLSWLKKAASNNQPCAMVDLGALLLSGDGVDKDVPKAIELFQKGFEGGRASGGYNLGVIYTSGEYTARDIERGIKYLEQAADYGSTESLVYLSKLYGDGLLVKVDVLKSKEYLLKAATAGNEEATKLLVESAPAKIQSCTASAGP